MSADNSKSTTQKLARAFGFAVEIVGSNSFSAHGDQRTVYTVKRPSGTKHLRAVMYGNGAVRAC